MNPEDTIQTLEQLGYRVESASTLPGWYVLMRGDDAIMTASADQLAAVCEAALGRTSSYD